MNLTIFLSWGYTQSLHPAHFLFALFSTSMSSSRQKFFTAFWFPSAPSSWLAQALPPPPYQWEVSSPFHPSPLLLFLSFFFFWQSLLPAFVSAFPLISSQSQTFHFSSLFFLPFVLSSSTPHFLKSSPVSSHLPTLPPLLSTSPLRCLVP